MVGEFGKRYSKDLQMKVMGTTDTAASKIVVDELNLPITPEHFLKDFRTRSHTLITNCSFMPGIWEVISGYNVILCSFSLFLIHSFYRR